MIRLLRIETIIEADERYCQACQNVLGAKGYRYCALFKIGLDNGKRGTLRTESCIKAESEPGGGG